MKIQLSTSNFDILMEMANKDRIGFRLKAQRLLIDALNDFKTKQINNFKTQENEAN